MKKIDLTVLLTAFLFAFSACDLNSAHNSTTVDDSIPVNGTVLLRINEVPLENSNLFTRNYNRAAPPPPIEITVFTEDMLRLTSAAVLLRAGNDEHHRGTHQWTLDIPANRFPGYFYFGVTTWTAHVAFGLAGVLTEKYWIEDESAVIDIGTINYDVVQLRGNLPVSVYNEPFTGSRRLLLTLLGGGAAFFPTSSTSIMPNGDWSFYLDRRYLESRIEFTLGVEVSLHNVLHKTLPPYTLVVSDAGFEVVFPDLPNGASF